MPIQCRSSHLSCRHGVDADSLGRPSESVLPDRTLSTLRSLPALSRNAGGEAGEVARSGCEPGENRGRGRELGGAQPGAEALGDAVIHHFRTLAIQHGPAIQHEGTGVREPLAPRRWPSGAMLLFLWVGFALSPARADVSPAFRCRAGAVLLRTDSKTCPTERGRPAAAVQRACCQGRNGKVRCMHYPPCPTRSPS